jgi:hypothetical protein
VFEPAAAQDVDADLRVMSSMASTTIIRHNRPDPPAGSLRRQEPQQRGPGGSRSHREGRRSHRDPRPPGGERRRGGDGTGMFPSIKTARQ